MRILSRWTLPLFCITCIVSNLNIYSQAHSAGRVERPSSCEQARAILDVALAAVAKTEKSYVIFVFRLGTGERSEKINYRRIDVVRKHIHYRIPGFERFILVRGDPSQGLARVDVFVEGFLYESIIVGRGKILGDNCLVGTD